MRSFFASALAMVALAASAVVAAPAPDALSSALDNSIAKRTPGNVLLCNTSGFQNCQVVSYTLPQNGIWPCIALPDRFSTHLGGIGPDHGALCRIWTDASCSEASNTVITSFPGISNLYNDNGVDHGHTARYIGCIPCSGC
ncbi:hypothetical protein B0H66DRAFT_558131 [Apodospora peruviana]|uniref:Small secreted protein n=1 Tax=Apodospora peruviana TaxID=516989 RepID=A0AAE0M4T8_9PEZI|nr:hypothetical protein B0H66DRAFT_558131 [Apodospora peruviana]